MTRPTVGLTTRRPEEPYVNSTSTVLWEALGETRRPYADVRPAWASTWRCKSSWELVMVTKGNRKLGTVRDLVEEAGNAIAG